MKTTKFSPIIFFISATAALVGIQSAIAESFSLSTNLEPNGQIDAFLAEAKSLLPEKIKTVLAEPITIEFDQINSNGQLEVPCAKPSITNDQEATPEPTVYASLDRQFLSGRPSRPLKIHLHSAFLPVIKRGSSNTKDFPCGHGNLYRTALASLIHEIGHAYDWSDSLLSRRDLSDLETCERERQYHGGVPTTTRCWSLINLRGRISGKLNYVRLAGFSSEKNRSKNFNPKRSPDPYETVDSFEYFGVNLEYFLLDPTYSCRKPAMHQFLKTALKFDPYPNAKCTPLNYAFTSTGGLRAIVDPNRVYAIHYLFADEGPQMMSKWGHSMFRLVVCAPGRKEVNEECLKDVAHHVVLSYRAYIDGPSISGWAGLTGKYPSQMLVSSIGEIVEEYASKEFRNLSSLPLNFTSAQKNLFVRRVLEQFWTYSGKYFFISNNCAQESDQLIKSVLSDTHPLFEFEILTPKGLLDALRFTNLTNASVLENKKEAESKGYFFPSRKPKLEKAFSEIIENGKGKFPYPSLDIFLTTTTAEARRNLFKGIQDRKILASYYLLEKAIRRNLEAKIQSEAAAWIFKFQETGDNAASTVSHDLLEAMTKLSKVNLSLQPWNIVKEHAGYGVPLEEELESTEEITSRYQSFFGILISMKEQLFAFFPELNQELLSASENIKLLVSKRAQ